MKRTISLTIFLLISLLLIASRVMSQQDDTCPAIVQTAVETAGQVCGQTGRNQACYGNVVLQAQAQEGFSNFSFEKPGDLMDVAGVKTITLSPLDRDANVWGVALMRVQANLPDTLPGQNVTFVLFGNVEVQNASAAITQPPTIDISTNTTANVRAKPSRNACVEASLKANQTVTADGRLEDNSWLRVTLENDAVGWVFAELVTVTGDVSSLQVYMPDGEPEAPDYQPMQAFYVSTGIGDAPCSTAPDSGLLIQTPQGARQINLRVNEVDIRLSSTAYLQAQAGGEMTVNLIEGQGQVSASGVTEQVPAGSQVRVALDANLAASAPPTPPEPYDAAALQQLPISLLERSITIAPALTAEEITDATAPILSRLVPDFYARYECVDFEAHSAFSKIEAPDVIIEVRDYYDCAAIPLAGSLYGVGSIATEYRLLNTNPDGSTTFSLMYDGRTFEYTETEENITTNVSRLGLLIPLDNRVFDLKPVADQPSFEVSPTGVQTVQIIGQTIEALVYVGGRELNSSAFTFRENRKFYYDTGTGLLLRQEFDLIKVNCSSNCGPIRYVSELVDTNQPLAMLGTVP